MGLRYFYLIIRSVVDFIPYSPSLHLVWPKRLCSSDILENTWSFLCLYFYFAKTGQPMIVGKIREKHVCTACWPPLRLPRILRGILSRNYRKSPQLSKQTLLDFSWCFLYNCSSHLFEISTTWISPPNSQSSYGHLWCLRWSRQKRCWRRILCQRSWVVISRVRPQHA